MKLIDEILLNNYTRLFVVAYCLLGPIFSMERTDNVVTLGSFILMFFILKAQDKQEKAMLLKLDELIRSSKADNRFIKIEENEQ